ncbi:hypothetical protein LO763_20600 [Glycomyces sp. A-F 0318]|uniref:response regulator n=1 Tax=Glycomyces amatae TaxID=2881355 RepID=UPI001E42FB6B|nr:response regulator [Glycomyces amatae]MCD0446016.1 hypothetical protein [Glycomyces amatae]
MSEAIWIELIKVLPAFLWIGFGFIALAVAKRIFSQQAPRMTRVETPWVTVELAQQAIEQAAVRGPVHETPWPPFAPLPSQSDPAGAAPTGDGSGAAAPGKVWPREARPWGGTPDREAKRRPRNGPDARPGSTPTATPPADGSGGEEFQETWLREEDDAWGDTPDPDARQGSPSDPAPDPKSLPTPPADRPSDDANGEPPAPVTAPRQVPPPPYQRPRPGGGHAPPPPADRTGYAAAVPLPPYAMPSAYQQPPSAETRRGLRAATRLALSADLLQGGAILWVDDHQEWNEPLIRLLRTAGITVDAVDSTDAAVRALGDRSYDLVITDMRREREPGGDTAGVRLLDRMIAAGVPTPAVFFSDHPGAVSHPRAATATNSPETLVDTVVDLVGARRGQRAPQAGRSWLSRLRL